jgi:hypothetical protein
MVARAWKEEAGPLQRLKVGREGAEQKAREERAKKVAELLR